MPDDFQMKIALGHRKMAYELILLSREKPLKYLE
jgi:hypothetical protein